MPLYGEQRICGPEIALEAAAIPRIKMHAETDLNACTPNECFIAGTVYCSAEIPGVPEVCVPLSYVDHGGKEGSGEGGGSAAGGGGSGLPEICVYNCAQLLDSNNTLAGGGSGVGLSSLFADEQKGSLRGSGGVEDVHGGMGFLRDTGGCCLGRFCEV